MRVLSLDDPCSQDIIGVVTHVDSLHSPRGNQSLRPAGLM
jgi:hypothetical protein